MNYYIQGCAANAEQIRAAFEKLGYDTSRHFFNTKSVLYFTLDGEIRATTCSCTPGIIKTHPDYKELELPVKPQYKVHDCVVSNGQPAIIHELKKDYYLGKYLNGHDFCHKYADEDKLHLWTIKDAKDGDVLMTTSIRSCPFIYRKTNHNNNLAYYYAGIDGNGNFCEGCLKRTLFHFGSVSNVMPATKEQRDLLFAKMKEAGYEWDAEKKELREIKPHYDISNFKPFDKVLVRIGYDYSWGCGFFSYYGNKGFACCGAVYPQCIPFNEDTKHLLGTTDMCDEYYINWK